MSLVRSITNDLQEPLLIDDGDAYVIIGTDTTCVSFVEKVQGVPINRYIYYSDEFSGWMRQEHANAGWYKANGGNTVNKAVCDAVNELFASDRDLTLVSTDRPIKFMALHRDQAEFVAGEGGYHFFTIYHDKSMEVDYHFTIPDLTEADITAFTQRSSSGETETIIAFLYDDETSLEETVGRHLGKECVKLVESLTEDTFDAYRKFDEDHDVVLLFHEVVSDGSIAYDVYFNPASLIPSIGKHLDGWITKC